MDGIDSMYAVDRDGHFEFYVMFKDGTGNMFSFSNKISKGEFAQRLVKFSKSIMDSCNG